MSDEIKNLLIGIERKLRRGSNPLTEANRKLVKAIVARLMAKPGSDLSALRKSLPGLLKVKAAVNPAMTTVAGWAQELTGEIVSMSGLSLLSPSSAYAQLSSAGLRLELPGNGTSIRIPDAKVDADPVDPFVPEAGVIPARSRLLENQTLAPHKAALLSVVTGELLRRGVPSIEAIVGRLLSQDVARGIDKILLGSGAATASRPAGILAGATSVTASTSTDAQTAALADVSALVAALADPAPAERPVLIMSAKQATAFALLFPGAGLPVVTSEFVAAGDVVALDAAAFATASNPDSFDIDISEEALVHADTAAGAAMAAGPMASLWQTECVGVRVIEDVDWSLLSKASVATAVKW